MNKKGAGQKGFLLVVFAGFISTGVFGEGENVVGYNKAEARIGFYHAEFSDSDSYAQEPHSVENTKPPLAMTTALKFDEPLGAYLRLSVVSEKAFLLILLRVLLALLSGRVQISKRQQVIRVIPMAMCLME